MKRASGMLEAWIGEERDRSTKGRPSGKEGHTYLRPPLRMHNLAIRPARPATAKGDSHDAIPSAIVGRIDCCFSW